MYSFEIVRGVGITEDAFDVARVENDRLLTRDRELTKKRPHFADRLVIWPFRRGGRALKEHFRAEAEVSRAISAILLDLDLRCAIVGVVGEPVWQLATEEFD